jgi:hypothetical protein
MSLYIRSCCVNDNGNAWILYNNGEIFFIGDVRNGNDVWVKINSTVENGDQIETISCGTQSNTWWLSAVTKWGQLYYAFNNTTHKPDWKKVRVDGYVKNCCVHNNGYAHIITNKDIVKYSNGRLDNNPPFNVTMKTPEGTPQFIRYTSDGYVALLCTNSKGTYVSGSSVKGNIVFIASNGTSSNPSWIARFGGSFIGNKSLAFAKSDGHIMLASGNGLQYKSRYDDGNTVGSITVPGKNFDQCSFAHGDLFIATTIDKYGGEVAWGYTKSISGYNSNGLINAEYYGKKYYGNSIPVKKAPYKITLKNGQIPLKHWRNETEYRNNGCGFSSGCDYNVNDRKASRKPYNDTGYPIESSRSSLIDWQGYKYGGGCAAGQYKGRCWVPADFLTHTFGQGTTYMIPGSGNQYGSRNPSTPSALELQITPFDKKISTPYDDNAKFSQIDPNYKEPTFSEISFNLPDPTEEVDIDVIIPLILTEYASSDYGRSQKGVTQPGAVLDAVTLNDYLSKYLFTNVNGHPRISFSGDTKLITKGNETMYDQSRLNTLISRWKQLTNNTFQADAKNYCKGENLISNWCISNCKTNDLNCDDNLLAFCKTGGTGSLPEYSSLPQQLPTAQMTQAMLKAAYPKYYDKKYAEVCGCNMPSNFYINLNIASYQSIPSVDKKDPTAKPGNILWAHDVRQNAVTTQPNCNNIASCKGNTNVIPNKSDILKGCASINLQNCIQIGSLSIGGDLKVEDSANSANVVQSMECTQIVNEYKNSLNPPPPAKTPPTPPAKTPPTPPAKTPPTITPGAGGTKTTVTNTGGGATGGVTTPVITKTPVKTPPTKSKGTETTVFTPPSPVQIVPPPSSSSSVYLYVGGGVVVLIIIIVIVIVFMKK